MLDMNLKINVSSDIVTHGKPPALVTYACFGGAESATRSVYGRFTAQMSAASEVKLDVSPGVRLAFLTDTPALVPSSDHDHLRVPRQGCL